MFSLESDIMTALLPKWQLTFTFYKTFSNSVPNWTTFVKKVFGLDAWFTKWRNYSFVSKWQIKFRFLLPTCILVALHTCSLAYLYETDRYLPTCMNPRPSFCCLKMFLYMCQNQNHAKFTFFFFFLLGERGEVMERIYWITWGRSRGSKKILHDISADLEIILSFLAAWLARQKISAK